MRRSGVLRKLSFLLSLAMLITSLSVPVMAQTSTGDDPVIVDVTEDMNEGSFDIVDETEKVNEESFDNVADDEDVVPDEANSYTDPDTGFYFDIISESEKTASITGYLNVGSSSDSLGDLNIPGTVKNDAGEIFTVTEIASEAFRAQTRFTGNLTIPDSVIRINDSAFDGCGGLKGSLIIPDNVAYIGSYAFRECKGMSGELKIGENVEEISDYAFFGCSSLQGGIKFPAKLKRIGASAFQGCTGFEGKLTFGNGDIEEIGNSAFSGLKITGGITFPGKVGSIGQQAFLECRKLDGPLVFMKEVGFIGKAAFEYCEKLTGNVTLNNTSVRDNAFEGCEKLGPVLTLGKNTTWDDDRGMYSHSFMYCYGIKKVVNNSSKSFNLFALKSSHNKDPWISWKDESGKTVYDIKNGIATREDFVGQYSITVTGVAEAYNPETDNVIYSAKQGETVGIQWSYFENDKKFVRWETKNKGVKFANPNSWQTTFTMPAEDVVITYVEKDREDEPYYSITMQEGSFACDENVTGTIDRAREGDIVRIGWYTKEDREFVRWETKNKGVIFEDSKAHPTTFVMPAENVTITYVEKAKGAPDPDDPDPDDPDPEKKDCPVVITKQKVDLSAKEYFGTEFEKTDKWKVEPSAFGSVSKGIFTAKKPGEVTVTRMDKSKNVLGTVKFTIETPEIDYPVNPKNGKKLTTKTYYRIYEEVDVTKLISTKAGPAPVKYECSDKNGKNFEFDAATNILTVKKTGNCKINVYYNYGDNEKYAAKYTINIKASLPKLKDKLNLKATKSTTVTITNVQKGTKVSWWATETDKETGEAKITDLVKLEEVPGSNGLKCKVTAGDNKGAEVMLVALVGEEKDGYFCKVTIK